MLLAAAFSSVCQLQEGSLLLLSERLPEVTSSARERIQNTTAQILECVQRVLLSACDSSLLRSAFDALRAIATTAKAKDETPLVAMVPTILQIVRGQSSNLSAISVLPILMYAIYLMSRYSTSYLLAEQNSVLA